MISVSQLTKAYGQTLAVDRVSFEVPKGEIVGFLGPNGAGKSTTIRMLTCYLAPTSGGATIGGFDIFHQSKQVRSIMGYLPESTPLYGEMRVEEYLNFRGQLRGMNRSDRTRRIDYVIDRCWLGNVRKRAISHLSKGYRQRVGLADALLHNPQVLVLDEPTAGLDPTQNRETRKLIKDLAGDHTVMLSTHILPEVEAICTRAIVITSGRIVAQGPLDDLRKSRKMNARVVIECKAPSEELKSALERVAGVRDVELIDNKEGGPGYAIAAIRPKEGYDVREEAARTVIGKGWPLREISLEHATLEEFFVQVTARQAQGAAQVTGGVS